MLSECRPSSREKTLYIYGLPSALITAHVSIQALQAELLGLFKEGRLQSQPTNTDENFNRKIIMDAFDCRQCACFVGM